MRAIRVEFAPDVESRYIDHNRETGEPIRSVLVDANRCLDFECNEWLPLGESNDKPEAVRVEIRAAEIAQRGTESGRYVDMGTSDWYGWIAACPGYEHVDRIDASELAGYLAHYIATHSEES